MKKTRINILIFLLGAILFSCTTTTNVVTPDSYESTDNHAKTYPDYSGIKIPSNIAPLNFNIDAYSSIVKISNKKGMSLVVQSDNNGNIVFDEIHWHDILNESRDATLTYTIFTKDNKDSRWVKHPEFQNEVKEEIDPFISYRLIEPGFKVYNSLGIYQRDIRSFDTKAIYENHEDNHCINCHTYQNRQTSHMMFHVRGTDGGTIIVNGNNVDKYNTKTDSTISACVYPSWHPWQNKIAFSTNSTGQLFYLTDSQRVEVLDDKSDLVLLDLEKNSIKYIAHDENSLETFPSWAPTGDRLYYCVCDFPKSNTSNETNFVEKNFKNLKYDIYSMAYDTINGTFCDKRLEVEATRDNQSATLPRISPDGKYLLYTLGEFGQFHIWHKSSDLYIKDLSTQETYPLSHANSKDVDSYHTWSSNGKWIIFSSRREDGAYTRLYITYIDENGMDSKPFILPQKYPIQNKLLLKSYNIPEFMIDSVNIPEELFRVTIHNAPIIKQSTFE